MGTIEYDIGDPSDLTMPAEVSTAGELVAGRFEDSKTYSTGVWNEAINAIAALKVVEYNITVDDIPTEFLGSFGLDGLNINIPVRPSSLPLNFAWPEFNAQTPTVYDTTIIPVTVPSYNVPDPGIVYREAPDDAFPDFNEEAPAINEHALPAKPGVALPGVPTLTFAPMPTPPEISQHVFDAVAPAIDGLEPPAPSFVWNEVCYNSALATQLELKIREQVINGSTGLSQETWTAIYERAKARQDLEFQEMRDNAADYFEERGAPLPQGAYNGILLDIDRKVINARTDLNNDILVQESNLIQKNTQFIIEKGLQLEGMFMDYTNNLQSRAFEAAKFTVTASLEVFQMRLTTVKIKADIFQILAQVYEAKLRSELVKAEIYKALISGVAVHADVQGKLVELYLAQLQGVNLLYSMYKTEMEGVQIASQIDKTKLEGFGYRIAAHAEKLKAITSKYEAHNYYLAGEKLKADVFDTQNRAYATKVGAFATQSQINLTQAQTNLARTQSEIEIYKSKLAKHELDIRSKMAEVDALVKERGLDIDIYKADTQQYAETIDGLTKVLGAKVEELKVHVQAEVSERDLNIRTALGKYQLLMESLKSIAQVASQMGAAAFAGVSASAHIGHGEQRSDSTARSTSDIDSNQYSRNYSVQHQYIHEVD